jgi:hypothetical protein
MDPADALWTSVRGSPPRWKMELFRDPREYVEFASSPLPAKLVRGIDESLRVALRINDVMAVCTDEARDVVDLTDRVLLERETLKLESPCGKEDVTSRRSAITVSVLAPFGSGFRRKRLLTRWIKSLPARWRWH